MKVFCLIIKLKVRALLPLVLFNTSLYSQINLVPNPSFEVYDTCPTGNNGIDQICRAVPWFQPNEPNTSWCGGSTDYYHSCANTVPNNYNGFQMARTGNGYAHAGIYAVNIDYGREYLEVQLITTLQLNKKYCVFFYVSKAHYLYSSTNCIGISFSADTLFQNNIGNGFNIITAQTHIMSNTIIQDTSNWSLVKGVYTAIGGERFITVGCFLTTTQVSYICPTPNPNSCGYCAYYFDDFGVYELPEIEAGNNDTICTTGGSVQLNANCTGCWPGLQYRWWPATGLNDTTVLNPTASPTQTTTYYVGLTDTSNTVPCIIDLTDSLTVYVCDTIAKPPSDTVFTFNLYPNPTFGELSLAFTGLSEDVILYIYDAIGRMAARYAIPKGTVQKKIDITPLSKAVYILKLQGKGIKEMRKLVKN